MYMYILLLKYTLLKSSVHVLFILIILFTLFISSIAFFLKTVKYIDHESFPKMY